MPNSPDTCFVWPSRAARPATRASAADVVIHEFSHKPRHARRHARRHPADDRRQLRDRWVGVRDRVPRRPRWRVEARPASVRRHEPGGVLRRRDRDVLHPAARPAGRQAGIVRRPRPRTTARTRRRHVRAAMAGVLDAADHRARPLATDLTLIGRRRRAAVTRGTTHGRASGAMGRTRRRASRSSARLRPSGRHAGMRSRRRPGTRHSAGNTTPIRYQ